MYQRERVQIQPTYFANQICLLVRFEVLTKEVGEIEAEGDIRPRQNQSEE